MKTLFCVVCILCAALLLPAQTFRGGIQGTVTNPTGHPVADATVTVASEETGLIRTAKTSSAGTYFVSELPIGIYELKVEKEGSRSQSLQGIKIDVSSNQRIDFQLKPKEVVEGEKPTQVMEMSSQSLLVSTTQDNQGRIMEARELQDLPISGRDIYKVIGLTPGVNSDSGGGANDSAGSFGAFSINGNRGRSNNFNIDGTDATDPYRNLPVLDAFGVFGVPVLKMPLDSLQEVSVLSNFEAEFGHNSGATVDFLTKSGTNRLHGSIYEYFRNNALDARNFFNAVGTPQDVFHNNQFGGSLGGPIVKDRTFFFVAYEGQRENVGFPVLTRVPTQAQLNQAIADNGGVVNPVIASLLSHGLWPAPNVPADSQGNNLVTSTSAPDSSNSMIIKIDQRFGEKDYLTGRYFYSNGNNNVPLALAGGGILPGFNTVTPAAANLATASYTHIFGMHLLTEVRAGYNHLSKDFFPQDQSFNPAAIALNLGTTAQDFGLPSITVANFAKLGAAPGDPRGRTSNAYEFFNNYTYTAGRHNWKFGYEYHRNNVDSFFDNGHRGSLNFSTLDAFIAGTPSSGSQAQGNSFRQTFQNINSLYLQDNFSLFSNLTLNYGVRWEYFGVIGEQQNQFSILDATGNLQNVSQLYPRDLNNFAPRVSLAWDIKGNGKTVLRAGWGVYYDAFSSDLFLEQLPFNTLNAGPAYNAVGPNPITFSFAPAAVLQPGVPVFAPASFSGTNVFTVDQRLRTPYVQNYNLNIERALGRNVAFDVGYVGSAGRKLFRYVDLNQFNPATGGFAFPALGVVNQIQTSASSGYNSLQSTLRFRNWHGFTSMLSYVWSHSIDNASDGIDFVPNASQPDNSFAPNRERASSNFDQRQHFTWDLAYQFPAYRKWHKLTSGWSMDGIFIATSGEPYNVNFLFEGDFNGSAEFFGRPDVVGNPFAGTGGSSQLLNLSALQVPCTLDVTGNCIPGTQHFGNLGRNAFVGPNYSNLDLSLAKTTAITERVSMQIRLDMFNPFNHPNFASPLLPNFAVDFLQNGMDASGRGVGFLSSTATPDVGAGNPFLGNGGPRNLQLAMRFSF
jgi:hypothetical protein